MYPITHDLNVARHRLSKFVMQKADSVTRNNHINYEESDTKSSNNYEDMRANMYRAIKGLSPFYVYKSASENTIYTNPCYNWAFRFWHDWLHYSLKADFSYEQELVVGNKQMADVAIEFGLGSLEWLLMQFDTIIQVEYYKKHGDFMSNQWAECVEWIAPYIIARKVAYNIQ